ncbi:receptor-like protein kinase FERONIA [Actinidia eriantha]|uniref:receptor-like protein kinase FERONIA n=1 Tax=Actinidia eriantha TaxID=165200 RepID=UPI0025902DE1|nr:receptor-like protein kinase FERONIA [Actinidia eriantha]XP_057514157.1 receptor-like protein kinase FERONIA [Actinidia eriantha]XP_057514165.1 receptor-like protein kinase FERONIA [Actinidia eriantha]XP_057514169.1 receptor-like protein kinase FERONIA [Actinidia eriantha]XP_057514170.1 receptor-like protein kinase FERONIA [Actinidia eriantha]XP_057514171.1 receptor-like protein kinase FERONIA [Actinidia eriantha]
MSDMSARYTENATASGAIPSEELCRCFSLSEILTATNNFDDASVIGIGGFGKVYKGSIDNNGTITVAIKRLKDESKQGAKEFWTEVKMLSKLRHTHLVALIGYCKECEEMILVYEYIVHGTLEEHLYKIRTKESGTSFPHLTWEQRLQICVGSARGLNYLHTGTHQSVIHRDVKTTNILLDEEWVAKISDFGLSKSTTSQSMTHVSTELKGTRGYLDPEYFYTHHLTTKSDVYAFGVVLLEVLCGRPPVDVKLEEEQISLVLWAQNYIKKGKPERIVEPFLIGQMSSQCLKLFVEVANHCLQTSSKARPTMAEVVGRLEFVLALHRKGKTEGIVAKMFKGMNQWWSWEAKDNSPRSESEAKDNSSKSESPKSESEEKDNKSKSESEENDNSHKSELERKFRCFSLTEIQAATEYFNNHLLIAHGGSSKVYKGFMDRDHAVAIKITNKTTADLFQDDAVTRIHSQICHDHVISLIGFCNESSHQWIHVYDYMANGSLQDHIYQTGKDPLVWKKRLEICIDAARGLQYLHAGGLLKAGVLIKPSKILLDEKWVAKIQINFSPEVVPTKLDTIQLYRFTHGKTPGNSKASGINNSRYIDPNFFLYGVSTQNSVLYSFGIVLFEVLCAKEKLLWRLVSHLGSDNILWSTIDEVIDPYLIRQIAPKCLRAFLNIAYSCVHREETKRPSMDDMLESLLCAFQLQEDWENQVQMGGDELPGIDQSLQLLFN